MKTRPVLYIAITSHGFGHVVRTASVAAKIQQLNPEILLVLVTTAPRWLLEAYIPGDFIHRPRAFDVGVIQSDSLQMDKAATLAKLKQIQQQQNALIAGEVNFIRTNRVKLILADIPFLATKIAQAAGIPCWMMSNFGWDFIYRAWGGEFSEIAAWISECYQECDRLFRFPLAESMSAFPQITDVGLTGGTPRFSEDLLRSQFQLNSPSEKLILLTFGGLGLQQIPYNNLKNFASWQFITFDRQAPELPNLVKVTEKQYRPVDFLPFCGRVVSKPGYSTFAEALRLDVPIVSLTREDFAEAALLLEGIQDYSQHQIITPEAFFGSDWSFLHQNLIPPRQDSSLDKNGTEAIAKIVVDYCTDFSLT
ncbi:MAG: glycosyl transferase [Oscillatoria sp. PMC 1068.18]|nr:glycosyl transferase [Oscillatoria sp. PMC 1076.18]MEC4988184.1 glycosyl transferase [Oscillatoria sp. PMC 1068.18]